MSDEITKAPQSQLQSLSNSLFTQKALSEQFQEQELDLTDNTGVHNNKFAFTPSQLHKLVTTRTVSALLAFGGLHGLAEGLRTDIVAGLSVDETSLDGTTTFEDAVQAGRGEQQADLIRLTTPSKNGPHHSHLHHGINPDGAFFDRKRIYGENRLPKRKQKSFLKLAWIAFNDKLMFLLTLSATVSLALGIYQSVDQDQGGSNIEWVDGVTVVVAIFVIVFASAATDWQKTHKFQKLIQRKEERDVTVVRSGKIRKISVHDVLVGDTMHIEAGDVVAVDGILIHGSGLQLDESSISGESELVHKNAVNESNDVVNNASQKALLDPFILSGTTVSGGVGAYLVTAVGPNSTYGRTLMSLREDIEETPLQQKLGRLAKQLITVGAIAGVVFFLVLLIRFLVQLRDMEATPAEKAEAFFEIVILAITVVVITVPEGLALAVTLALAFATTRMLKDNNLVRLIRSCEIMGNATCVCSDKTGTLTQNKMTVVTGMVGMSRKFGDIRDPSSATEEAGDPVPHNDATSPDSTRKFVATLTGDTKTLIKNSIALNSTAFENGDPASSQFVGSSTETALLKFARDHLAMGPLSEERANNKIISIFPFDASRKWMAVLIKIGSERYRLLVKGAAEVVLEHCTDIILDPKDGNETQPFTQETKSSLQSVIRDYASQMLRPVVMAYRDVDAKIAFEDAEDLQSVNFEKLFCHLSFIGVVGIRDPLRPEVIDSVRLCQEAGVFVRMVTGDNFLTAKAIAAECGIYTTGGIAMDGATFRRLSPLQLDKVIPRLQVLARSSPEDKLLLVSHLKGMGETVAVTGDGTNDALALKAADVGFAMGIQGTEVAKEAASIILLDDNFASIVKALSWGRTVNDATKKFLQFQFTINISAGTLTVVSTLVGDSVFTVVQLLFLNLIMDIFASLGLATDYPSPDFLKRKPEPRTAPIVSITMWKMILGQAIYQLAVVFTIHYAGWALFKPDTEYEIEQLQTLVFNIYVWMQFFNQHNCRRVDNKLNIWYQGVLRNPWFLGVQCATFAGQMVIIFKGGEAFDTRPLTGAHWGWSMLFGILTIPLGALLRQVPDDLVYAFFQIIKGSYQAVYNTFVKLLPKRWRKKKTEEDMGAAESWVLQTGAVLLRPIKYQWGTDGPPPSAGLAGKVSSIPLQQREVLSRAAAKSEAGKGEIDIETLIDAVRYTNVEVLFGLEVHPGTSKDDPVLLTHVGVDGKGGPPSQDPELLRYLQTPTPK